MNEIKDDKNNIIMGKVFCKILYLDLAILEREEMKYSEEMKYYKDLYDELDSELHGR